MSHKQYSKYFRSGKYFYFIGAAIFICVIGASVYRFFPDLFVCHRLSCLDLGNRDQWDLTQIYEEKRDSVYRALYKESGQKDAIIMRVDVRHQIDGDTATDYIRGRIAGMKALYDNVRSPYPGLLSNEIVCDDAYKPTYTSSANPQNVYIERVSGYLNDRMTFGSCQEDQAAYKGVLALFACPKRKLLYQIEMMAPPALFSEGNIEEIFASIDCR